MPTFYQTPGIGQLDSSHIDSDDFAYVESLVTEEEWAALNAVSAETVGLSAQYGDQAIRSRILEKLLISGRLRLIRDHIAASFS